MAGAEARAGFYYQHIVAALYALDLLEFGSHFRSITLESQERAKHIDDIIVDHTDGTTFTQVMQAEDEAALLPFTTSSPLRMARVPLSQNWHAGVGKSSLNLVKRR